MAAVLAQSFIEAQTTTLSHYGVEFEQRFVDALTDDLRSNAVGFLEDVLDGLGLDRPAFVANSLGSLWAMWFAIDRPARVSALVRVGCPAIVLDTSAPLPMRLLSIRLLGRLMMKLQPPSPRQVKQLSKMVNEYPLPPEIADLLLASEQLPDFEATFLATLHSLVRLRGARPDMVLTRHQLAQVKHPSQLIFATNDPMGAASVGEQLAGARAGLASGWLGRFRGFELFDRARPGQYLVADSCHCLQR